VLAPGAVIASGEVVTPFSYPNPLGDLPQPCTLAPWRHSPNGARDVTGRCHPALAMDIAEKLGVTLTEANLREFADGEIHCRFDESIRGAHVFIVQTHARRSTTP